MKTRHARYLRYCILRARAAYQAGTGPHSYTLERSWWGLR